MTKSRLTELQTEIARLEKLDRETSERVANELDAIYLLKMQKKEN